MEVKENEKSQKSHGESQVVKNDQEESKGFF